MAQRRMHVQLDRDMSERVDRRRAELGMTRADYLRMVIDQLPDVDAARQHEIAVITEMAEIAAAANDMYIRAYAARQATRRARKRRQYDQLLTDLERIIVLLADNL